MRRDSEQVLLRFVWTAAPHHKPLAWMIRGAMALPSTPRAGWLPRLHSKVTQLGFVPASIRLWETDCAPRFEQMWFLASCELKILPSVYVHNHDFKKKYIRDRKIPNQKHKGREGYRCSLSANLNFYCKVRAERLSRLNLEPDAALLGRECAKEKAISPWLSLNKEIQPPNCFTEASKFSYIPGRNCTRQFEGAEWYKVRIIKKNRMYFQFWIVLKDNPWYNFIQKKKM